MQKCFTTIVLQRDKTILVKQPMTLVMTYDRETIVVNDGDDVVEGEAGRQMAHVFPVLKQHTTHCSHSCTPTETSDHSRKLSCQSIASRQ